MPPAHRPTPLYGWLCVVQSAAEILGHATRIRAAQAARASTRLKERHRHGRTSTDKLDAASAVNDTRKLEVLAELPSDGQTEPVRHQGAEKSLPAAIRASPLAKNDAGGPSISNEKGRQDTVQSPKLLETDSPRNPSAKEVESVSLHVYLLMRIFVLIRSS